MKHVAALCTCIAVAAVWFGCAEESSVRSLSQSCTLSSECDGALVCVFGKCRQACKSSRDCETGERCVQGGQRSSVCQKQGCSRNSECVGSQVCAIDAQCRDQCLTQKDCLTDQVCTGGSCADYSELVNGVLPNRTTDGGVATRCAASTDCPGDLVCLRGGFCGPECIVDRDCPRTYACKPVGVGGPGRCYPSGEGMADAGPPPAPGALAAVTASGHSTCALFAGGKTKCWGLNAFGQLGLDDTRYRGDGPSEMGDALPFIHLGTARSVKALASGEWHVCAILDNGRVKCWGANNYGQLGLGDIVDRGDSAGDMGDALPYVDLGAGRTAKAISSSTDHACAILDNSQVKCWGRNDFGQLGLGDTTRRGDSAGQMGDALPYVDLGTGRSAKGISAGGLHTCALLDSDQVKCWGYNANGQLGVGDNQHRGDTPGEMGNALPVVSLGTGRSVKTLAASPVSHTCAILDNDQLKCWGSNQAGALGLGDTVGRGIGPGQMGDALPFVDLGAGRSAKSVVLGEANTCAILDTGRVKCWGSNMNGKLGLGDTLYRGGNPGEMGDALPYVELGAARTAKFLSANKSHVCALLDNDGLKCWGYNLNGQLGLGDVNHRGDAPGEMGDALPYVKLVGP